MSSGGIRGGNLGGLGSIAVMYGAFPPTESPRSPIESPWIPSPNVGGIQIPGAIPPTTPTDAANLILRMQERAEWLRNELKMHEAWRLELTTLERMLAVYPTVPLPSNTQDDK